MRILLLIIQYPPDSNPTGRLMAQFVTEMRDCGHEIDVITSFPHYAQFRIWPEYRGKLAARDRTAMGDVLRLWVYASGTKQRMLHRLASYLSFNALATVAGALARRSYDVILAPNGSFFTGVAATILGKMHRIPFVYNVQDLYPEVPVHAGQLRNRHAIAGLERLERLMYRQAAQISVIAPSFRANLIAKGVPPAKVHVIPNFVDTEFIRPLPRSNPFSQAYDLEQRFVVSYAGNMGYVYDLEILLEAAALLAQEKEILFLIVGEGVSKPDLERKVRDLSLDNVRFLPFQPLVSLPWLRAAADVQVALHRPGTTGYSLPSKIYEIMASGRPLLASADASSDVANLVQDVHCGLCVTPGDANQLADAILTLYRDPALRWAMGQRGRQYAEHKLSCQVVVEQYQQLFAQIVAPSSAPDREQTARA
jgi:colanic acid biosynthesis glycosyl transferase WcaI